MAAIVAAVVVPVGFALSLESGPAFSSVAAHGSIVASTVVATPSVFDGNSILRSSSWPISDPVRLLLAGTAFLAVAAVARRAL